MKETKPYTKNTIKLSKKQQHRLAQVLMNPPKANQALLDAAKAYDSHQMAH